ncbi:hypothetical protein AAG570_012757 [Ranatra chinensis]|uniref:Choline/carnitine acyltransferase domain-containing protein n=1 Tax=Ranatra chinensis TaxID=642074 RepID=A0ABD0YET6_9HEMI
MHFQPSLPRLPIPELQKTCERYLRAQKPLLSEPHYSSLEKMVKQFLATSGPQLQKELKAIDAVNKHTSYISEPWFDLYLKDRKPIPINYNPFLVFVNDPKEGYNDQSIRATNLVISSLRFMKSLRANLLEPEVFHLNPKKSDTQLFRTVTGMLPSSLSWYGAYLFKAYPLDMSQYENLFNTSRIPELNKDRLYHDSSRKHILIMKGGNLFSLNVLDESGTIIDPQTLLICIRFILKHCTKKAEHPVGVLTTENRDQWAIARKHLESIGNIDHLKSIDGSLFNLVLDDVEPTTEWKTVIRQFLHSDGRNRWFDKSFSLIVNKGGMAGLNFEHSWGDGIAVLRYFENIYKDSTQKPCVHPGNVDHNCTPEQLVKSLEFKLDDKAKAFISEADKKYDKTCKSLDVQVYEFNHFGKKLCKVRKISPDYIMQLAFQIAHDKLMGKQVATYESCSTAAFKHGRTETVRPCTVETKAFCKLLNAGNEKNILVLREMIKKCSEIHGQLIKEAAMGQGFDRHMFALNLLAQKNGNIPDVFVDPSYATINHNILSTSTLNSDVLLLGAFGPVVEDGYGIGYSIWNERLGSIVTNYSHSTDGEGFIACMEGALNEIYKILQ